MRAFWPLLTALLCTPAFAAPRDFGALPARGVITFHNASDTAGNAAVRVRGAQGAATWRAAVPGHGAVAVEIGTIASGALLNVEVDAGFSGYAQPLMRDPASGMIINRSPCITDTAAALHIAAGIKATAESILRFESFGAAAQTPVMSVYDTGGNFIGTWTAPAVQPRGSVVVSGADLAAALASPATQFTVTLSPAFQGRLVHQQASARGPSDLTAKCAVGPEPAKAASAPAQKIERAAATGILIRDDDGLGYNLQGTKWGDPAPGTPATVPYSFFDPANGPSFLQPNGFPYVDAAMPPRARTAVRQAIHLWEQAANIRYVETNDRESKLRVGYGYWQSQGIAAGSFPCDACTNAGRAIVTFAREAFVGTRRAEPYLLDIAAHEFGHTIGLNHDLVRSSVMGFAQRALSPVQLKGLAEGDIAGVRALYGANLNPQKQIEDDIEAGEFTDALLTPAAPFAGRLETADDEDWFVVALIPGNDYVFTVEAGENSPLTAPRLELRTSELSACCNWSNLLLSSAGTKGTASVAFTPSYPGYYWLAVKGATESATGRYQVSMQETVHPPVAVFSYTEGSGDFPGTLDTTGHISLFNGIGYDASASLVAQINQPGDVDWFRFQTEPGKSYAFTVTGSHSYVADTFLEQPRLILRDDTGKEIARDDTSGPNGMPLITYNAEIARNLILDVQSRNRAAGGYTVTVNATPIGGAQLAETQVGQAGDLPASLASPAAIGAGQTFKGTIATAGDSDWLRFRAQENHIYMVTLKGVDGNGGTLADPVLRLRGPEGQLYGVRDDTAGNRDGALYLYHIYGQDLWLDAGGFGGGTGTYTLEVTEVPKAPTPYAVYNPEYAPLTGDIASLPLNGSTPALLFPGAEGNGYRAFLTAGHLYRVTIPAREQGGFTDVNLQLRNPDGNLVGQATGLASARADVVARAPVSGMYTVQVRPATVEASGTYRLELSLDAPGNIADAATTDISPNTLYFRTGPTLTPGNTITAKLEDRDDRDVFLIQIPPNTWYKVSTATPAGSTATLPPKLYVPGHENVSGAMLQARPNGELDTANMFVRTPGTQPFKIVLYNDRDTVPFGDGLYTLTMRAENPNSTAP